MTLPKQVAGLLTYSDLSEVLIKIKDLKMVALMLSGKWFGNCLKPVRMAGTFVLLQIISFLAIRKIFEFLQKLVKSVSTDM